MSQYDIEWGEIAVRTKKLINSIIEPYSMKLMEAEKLLSCAVGDIRNQETVLVNL